MMNSISKSSLLWIILLVSLLKSAWAQPALPTVFGAASREAEASKFVMILKVAGLTDQLSENGPYTLFLPTNEAIELLPENEQQALFKNPDVARRFALDHLITGKAVVRNLRTLPQAPTMGNLDLSIHISGRQLLVNEAHLVKSDIEASNGVIHVIDRVLVNTQNIQLVQSEN